jgi:aryl-alcohol dehydrogenase-like predicted oxidoreductase
MDEELSIAGFEVGRVGLGTMQLAGAGAMGEPADAEACRRLVRAAVDAGVRLIDTSGYYGPGVANRLLAEALAPYPDDLLIATKVGARRTADGGFAADATPEAVRAAVHDNLRQLGIDRLALVHARAMPDSTVPFEETVGALAELQDEGLVDHVGVSNVDLELLDRASSVTTVASIENELRVGHGAGRDVLAEATRRGTPYLAFRPLGNGALLAPGSDLCAIAEREGVAPATLALAWVLAQGPTVVAIPGTSSTAHLAALLAASSHPLTDGVLAELDALVPA